MQINTTVYAVHAVSDSLDLEPFRVSRLIERILQAAPTGLEKSPLFEQKSERTAAEEEIFMAIKESLMPAMVRAAMPNSLINLNAVDAAYDVLSRRLAAGTLTAEFILDELFYGRKRITS